MNYFLFVKVVQMQKFSLEMSSCVLNIIVMALTPRIWTSLSQGLKFFAISRDFIQLF